MFCCWVQSVPNLHSVPSLSAINNHFKVLCGQQLFHCDGYRTNSKEWGFSKREKKASLQMSIKNIFSNVCKNTKNKTSRSSPSPSPSPFAFYIVNTNKSVVFRLVVIESPFSPQTTLAGQVWSFNNHQLLVGERMLRCLLSLSLLFFFAWCIINFVI